MQPTAGRRGWAEAERRGGSRSQWNFKATLSQKFLPAASEAGSSFAWGSRSSLRKPRGDNVEDPSRNRELNFPPSFSAGTLLGPIPTLPNSQNLRDDRLTCISITPVKATALTAWEAARSLNALTRTGFPAR